MSVPALYFPVLAATPVLVAVRVWRKREDPAIGEGAGTQQSAQMIVPEDRVRFELSAALPLLRRLGVVSVEAGEAYRIDHLYPADGDYQTARVVPLTAAEATGLAVPT